MEDTIAEDKQELMSNLERITGFKTVNTLKPEDGGYFLLAYCIRHDHSMSEWFSEQGSFDFCDGVYNTLQKMAHFMGKYSDDRPDVYTIFFEMDQNKNKAIKVFNKIDMTNHPFVDSKNSPSYHDWLVLADNVDKFEIADHIIF